MKTDYKFDTIYSIYGIDVKFQHVVIEPLELGMSGGHETISAFTADGDEIYSHTIPNGFRGNTSNHIYNGDIFNTENLLAHVVRVTHWIMMYSRIYSPYSTVNNHWHERGLITPEIGMEIEYIFWTANNTAPTLKRGVITKVHPEQVHIGSNKRFTQFDVESPMGYGTRTYQRLPHWLIVRQFHTFNIYFYNQQYQHGMKQYKAPRYTDAMSQLRNELQGVLNYITTVHIVHPNSSMFYEVHDYSSHTDNFACTLTIKGTPEQITNIIPELERKGYYVKKTSQVFNGGVQYCDVWFFAGDKKHPQHYFPKLPAEMWGTVSYLDRDEEKHLIEHTKEL